MHLFILDVLDFQAYNFNLRICIYNKSNKSRAIIASPLT